MKRTLIVSLLSFALVFTFALIASAVEEKVLTNRGCPACHVKYGPDKDYTLYGEAKLRGGKDHPKKSPDNVLLSEETTVETCLQCHAAGKGGKGKKSPYSLRDITHPAHMFSPAFKNKLNGSCFSCHNVTNEGRWVLLARKVVTDDKGIPKKRPIMGSKEIVNFMAGEDKPETPRSSNGGLWAAIVALGLLNVVTLGMTITKRK